MTAKVRKPRIIGLSNPLKYQRLKACTGGPLHGWSSSKCVTVCKNRRGLPNEDHPGIRLGNRFEPFHVVFEHNSSWLSRLGGRLHGVGGGWPRAPSGRWRRRSCGAHGRRWRARLCGGGVFPQPLRATQYSLGGPECRFRAYLKSNRSRLGLF